MANRVIAKKQALSLLVVFVLVLLLVLASAPIVQATGGTIPEPIPNKPEPNSSGDSISDAFLGLLLVLMSLGIVL